MHKLSLCLLPLILLTNTTFAATPTGDDKKDEKQLLKNYETLFVGMLDLMDKTSTVFEKIKAKEDVAKAKPELKKLSAEFQKLLKRFQGMKKLSPAQNQQLVDKHKKRYMKTAKRNTLAVSRAIHISGVKELLRDPFLPIMRAGKKEPKKEK